VGAVAAGGVGDGYEDELCIRHLRDHLFGDAEFRRVDEVVCGVDPEDGSGDGRELRRGVVVARGVDVVEEVVGIGVGDVAGDDAVDVGFGLSAGGVVFLELERSAARDDDQVARAAETFRWFGGVLTVLPGGIVADGLHRHVAPHAVAAGELDGEAGEGSKCVGELGEGLAPDEGLHAAHGGAEDEAEMVDVETVGEHGVLGGDHVVVVVLREVHVEAVGGFAGVALADVVGEDDEEFCDVEWLARAEEDVGEDGIEERVGVAAGAVEEKDGVVGVAGSVAVGLAESEVMELELG